LQTIKLQLEDNLYENILNSKIDVQAKFQEFLLELVDDGYLSISTEEAKKRVSDAVEDYYTNPQKFSKLDSDFWDDTEKRLLQRHS
jgi:polyhydroxyalkanoate synthesis regulator phasin